VGARLTLVVTGPIVAKGGAHAALSTANGLYAVVFVMCVRLGLVTLHRQYSHGASH